MATNSRALRWKKEPHKTGLRSVGASARASTLHDGQLRYAMVYAYGRYSGRTGWYWVAGWESTVPYYNSSRYTTPLQSQTEDEAKSEAMKYVKTQLLVKRN